VLIKDRSSYFSVVALNMAVNHAGTFNLKTTQYPQYQSLDELRGSAIKGGHKHAL
jgi:hypothetical protein